MRSCASAGTMTSAVRTRGSARRSMSISLRSLQYSAETQLMRVLAALLFALPLSAALLRAAPQPPAKPELETVLNRAGWYLDYFVDEFENVVAEENYIQDSSQSLPTISPAGGGRGAIAPRPRRRRCSARAIAISARTSCS